MTVEFSGPLFDGTAQRLLDKGADEAETTLAERVQNDVRSTVRSRAAHSTGFYASRVVLERGRGDTRVSDNRARYGGWLEGTWPRNARTGFRGWQPWEKALQKVESEAAPIAERELGPYIDRMG